MESWRAALLHRKLRFRGYPATLTPCVKPGEWQVILPIVAQDRAPQQVHFDRAVHENETELRTVKLRDVTGAVRTVRLHDVTQQLATVKVLDVEGREYTFRVKVHPLAPVTPLEHRQRVVHALLAMHAWSWLLSGWDCLHLHHLEQPRERSPSALIAPTRTPATVKTQLR
ncbi:MAG TPA: hypothetical protein VF120_15315 [Ktedonobacterales bacterium]